tara:strand:- start:625 stop:825 length:201 start_codon:yes stop_codon:yes gene_type:complete
MYASARGEQVAFQAGAHPERSRRTGPVRRGWEARANPSTSLRMSAATGRHVSGNDFRIATRVQAAK